jgi:hypothetical protein
MEFPPATRPAHYDVPGNKQQIIGMIAGTTNMTSLVAQVVDAYRLTISIKRDLAEIEGHYRTLAETNRQLHDEIMTALQGSFAERAMQIGFIERMATQLIHEGQHDIAHSVVTQLMVILRKSPVEEVFGRR